MMTPTFAQSLLHRPADLPGNRLRNEPITGRGGAFRCGSLSSLCSLCPTNLENAQSSPKFPTTRPDRRSIQEFPACHDNCPPSHPPKGTKDIHTQPIMRPILLSGHERALTQVKYANLPFLFSSCWSASMLCLLARSPSS